jgi:hypothetical protein
MTFSKVDGPAWLQVDPVTGALSGTPGAGDVGDNVFTVGVDATGGSDTATLNIAIEAALPYPAVKFMGTWGPRFILPSAPGENDYIETWDSTAFADQFTQLGSSKYVFVNVSKAAGGGNWTSPNPPLVAAVPELAPYFPTRDILGETLDLIQESGREAIVYIGCIGFEGNAAVEDEWLAYIKSDLGSGKKDVDGLCEYIIKKLTAGGLTARIDFTRI